jgi:acetoin utilization deacetylase AcuC-like enzyme
LHTIYTDRHKLHATDGLLIEGQPTPNYEVPARAEVILNAVQASRLGPVSEPTDHGLDPILAVHDAGFVDFLQNVYARNAAYYGESVPFSPETFAPRGFRRKPGPRNYWGLAGYYSFGVGSPILEGTWEAAYWSAQCALSAADAVLVGERVAYALCRPPGHHAARDLYGGFCFLNNAAIAARYLQTPYLPQKAPSNSLKVRVREDAVGERSRALSQGDVSPQEKQSGEGLGVRVALLDIDYHHGNGTQEIFYSDPTVLYCSLHADPDSDYPYYWGGADERGEGAGEGANRNWPLPPKTGDATYLAALDEALGLIREFEPRYLVISAGFDIVADDPVGGFTVTTDGLHEIGQRIAALSRHTPTVIVQEGGYLLERLGENAIAFLSAFVTTQSAGGYTKVPLRGKPRLHAKRARRGAALRRLVLACACRLRALVAAISIARR